MEEGRRVRMRVCFLYGFLHMWWEGECMDLEALIRVLICGCAEERQRLADAVRHHQRDRNRAPSEPAGMLPFQGQSL